MILLFYVLYAIALAAALARAGHRSRTAAPGTESHRAPERILIVGATGGTGRLLVAQALGRGFLVTAFVRDPAKLGIEHPRLTVRRGDVLDAASLDAAVRGQDAVVSALGHRPRLHPTRILSDGTRNILGAMQTHGVRRFVCATSLGIGDSAGRLGLYYTLLVVPVVLPFYFWDKARQERIIAGSGIDWVIVRPGALTDGAPRGHVRRGGSIGSFLFTVRIARADVADFMLNQLVVDTHLGTAPGVCW